MKDNNKTRWINEHARTLSVSAECMKELQGHARDNRKIQAIKALRNEVSCGLKEAKEAVEAHFSEFGHSNASTRSGVYKIIQRFRIVDFTIEAEQGRIKVDLEGLQMHALMGMDTMGLDECQRILDLVKVIEDWANGTGTAVDSPEDEDNLEHV